MSPGFLSGICPCKTEGSFLENAIYYGKVDIEGRAKGLAVLLSYTDRRADRRLARDLKAGKGAAWEQFYALYAPALFRFVMTLADECKGRAADITQDAMVTAIERIRTYDPKRGGLWAWLCGIAANKRREYLRTAVRDNQLQQQLQSQPAAREPTSDDRSSEVLHVLAQVNPRHQEVLSLKYMEGCSVQEIAKRLAATEKAVESRLSRAREAFRKAYERWESASSEGTRDGG